MKYIKSVALSVVATLAIAGSFGCSKTAKKTQSNLKPAPDFTLKDANGSPVTLSEYRGKVVLLNFWATWCGPCKIEIPWFMEFEKQYKNKGFAVLGVAMDDEGWSIVKPYVNTRKMNYRVVLGSDSVAASYGGIESLPTTFVITREGRIATTHIGLVGRNEYSKEIEGLLNEEVTGVRPTRSIFPALFGFRPAQ